MEEKQKQIHIFVPEYLHREIRVASAEQGISMMQFVIKALLEQLQKVKLTKEPQ